MNLPRHATNSTASSSGVSTRGAGTARVAPVVEEASGPPVVRSLPGEDLRVQAKTKIGAAITHRATATAKRLRAESENLAAAKVKDNDAGAGELNTSVAQSVTVSTKEVSRRPKSHKTKHEEVIIEDGHNAIKSNSNSDLPTAISLGGRRSPVDTSRRHHPTTSQIDKLAELGDENDINADADKTTSGTAAPMAEQSIIPSNPDPDEHESPHPSQLEELGIESDMIKDLTPPPAQTNSSSEEFLEF